MLFYVNNKKFVKKLSKSQIADFWGEKRFSANTFYRLSPVFSALRVFFSVFLVFCSLTDRQKTFMIVRYGFCGTAAKKITSVLL